MDQSVRTIWTDSSTTASEMCEALAAKNRMDDSFGFSLFLALDNKVNSALLERSTFTQRLKRKFQHLSYGKIFDISWYRIR